MSTSFTFWKRLPTATASAQELFDRLPTGDDAEPFADLEPVPQAEIERALHDEFGSEDEIPGEFFADTFSCHVRFAGDDFRANAARLWQVMSGLGFSVYDEQCGREYAAGTGEQFLIDQEADFKRLREGLKTKWQRRR